MAQAGELQPRHLLHPKGCVRAETLEVQEARRSQEDFVARGLGSDLLGVIALLAAAAVT